ncbi:hypothetical protein ACIQOW_11195 [Kitasatospora sp. NPDC091335]|uniref:hypothetical protein n=1 Tax=Kitasatospora sp. NPDC091335 TaxID=3364085 RepID=UPI0037F4F106
MTSGFVDGDSLPAMVRWGATAENFWRLPVDPASLRADRLDETRDVISSLLTGRDATALGEAVKRADLNTTSGLFEILTLADGRYQASLPLSAIGPAGVAGVATVVLFLAAVLTTDRRAAEIRLLLARGGSRAGVLRRLLAEGAVVVLPAAVLGTALALVLLPTPRWERAVLSALVATLIALLALPVRAALLRTRQRQAGGRRRLVGELTVVALTVAAVAEVRRRGVGHPGAGVDPLLVAAPLLLAVTGGLSLARTEPVLVGRLATLAGRGRGLIGFLGLSRAARDGSGRRKPSVLPLLALLIAVTTTGFGATVRDNSGAPPVGLARLIADNATAGGKDAHGLPAGYTVHSGREAAAALGDDPLQHAAGRLFRYAAAAGAGYALLAVPLTLFRAAADRTALLARLRTMGLRPRQGLALILTEALPQTLAAAWSRPAVALLGGAFDISSLVGARVGEVVTPTLLPVLLPTAGLALLVGLGVVVETLVAGRRQVATELRAGEES